jgi:hypothetical protein
LPETDKAEVHGWWSVAKEASDAIRRIEEPLNSRSKPSKRKLKNSGEKQRA